MDFVISRATAADAADLGIIGPAAYAAAYHDDWDDAVGFFHQVQSFGPEAMTVTLARADARVWIARQDSAGVGFLTMFVGSLEPINQRPNGAEIPRIYLLPGARRGVGLALERMLSPAFIRGESYGTRACTLIAIDYDGHGWISERRFGPGGMFEGETTLRIGRIAQ